MQTKVKLLTLLCFLSLIACDKEDEAPDTPLTPNFTEVSVTPGTVATVTGNIEEGGILSDLAWASTSNVACWVNGEFYEGSHVFYSVDFPQSTVLKVTLQPNAGDQDINLYGYIQFDGNNLPPVTNVTSCEASPSTVSAPAMGEEEYIEFNQAVNRGFTALIGVAGGRGVTEGDFTLQIEVEN